MSDGVKKARLDSQSFADVRRVFFVGIGGIGISAIARMFLLLGKEVYGSDLSESEVTEELRKLGAKIVIGQGIELIPKDADLIIYTVAIEKYAADLLVAIKSSGVRALSYPEALHELSKGKYTIAVAGTHGKTTTTAMIAKVLIDAGLDPTVIVGSLLVGEKSNFIAGKSKYFVVEACEYKRSFLQLEPTIGVILNIDDDHLDYYGDITGVQKGFSEFVSGIKKDGVLVTDPNALTIAPIVEESSRTVLDYMRSYDKELKLSFPGEHVRKDAAVALAVAKILGIDELEAKKSLAEFRGTWRRFEFKGKMRSGALVYDDYGHHPTEIAATISGAREMFPDKHITIVFQPHLFSRTKEHLKEFGEVLSKADRVILHDIYPARETFDSSISSADVMKRVSVVHKNVSHLKTFGEIEAEIKKTTTGNDVIFTMGAGDIYKVAEELIRS
jgi:UDP-N-acetylmuramate--alanine ligase